MILFLALLYWYAAYPYNVVDGDTIDATIDVGFHQRLDERLRLVWYDDQGCVCVVGVDTPELRSRDANERKAAQDAKAFTQQWLTDHAALNTDTKSWGGTRTAYFLVRTEKDDAFGRWLADVRDQAGNSLGKDLLDSGHAQVWTP